MFAVNQATYGLVLLLRPHPSLFLPGGVGNLAIVALSATPHTARIPFFGPEAEAAEDVGTLDLFVTMSEMALIAVLLALSRGRGLSRER